MNNKKQMQDKLMSIVVEHDENGVKIVGMLLSKSLILKFLMIYLTDR